MIPNPWVDFLETRLDLRHIYQSTTIIQFSTSVERQQSQAETRRPTSAYPLRAFEIDGQRLHHDDLSTFTNFFASLRGRLTGFRWRDITNCKLSAKPVVSGYDSVNGTALWSQGIMIREQGMGPNQGRVYQVTANKDKNGHVQTVWKPIYKLDSTPVVINLATLAPVPVLSFNPDTGVLTFSDPVGQYGVTVDFDTPVRFDDDTATLDVSSTQPHWDIRPRSLPSLSLGAGWPSVAPLGYLQSNEGNKAGLRVIKLVEIVPDLSIYVAPEIEPPPTVIYVPHNFNVPDGTTIAGRAAYPGGPVWLKWLILTSPDGVVLNGRANSNGGDVSLVKDFGLTSYTMGFDFSIGAIGSQDAVGLTIRADGAGSSKGVTMQVRNGSLYAYESPNTTIFNQIFQTPFIPILNNIYTTQVVVTPTTIDWSINGTSVWSVNNSTYGNATHAGFQIAGVNSTLDNFFIN